MSHGRGIVQSALAPVGGMPIVQPVEVIQDTHDDLNANANIQVGDADATDANPVPSDEILRTEAAWTTLVNAIRIDDAPTSYDSAGMGVTEYNAVWLLIDIDSTLAPTDLRVLPQFTDDGGTTWWDFEEGLFASLFWEDTDTAAGINKAYLLPCGGINEFRIRVIGTGTDATNFFDVTVLARAFRGNFGVAHA